MFAICGDNLGSHGIGGFTENFSTSAYFCRYCLVQRSTFRENPSVIVDIRNPENYNESVQACGADQGRSETQGIKRSSLFNDLKEFHVCNPGLPPCIGHDLFEVVVSVDLALFISHFVNVKKFFTFDHLNRTIANFKYLSNDGNSKPVSINSNGKILGGNAAKNWYLLRLLPFFIGDKIENPKEDVVWNKYLQLRHIVNLVCSPKISDNQIAILKVKVEE